MPTTNTITAIVTACTLYVSGAKVVREMRQDFRRVHVLDKRKGLLFAELRWTRTIWVTASGYCAGKCCTTRGDGITASGARVKAGVTSAANGYPLGTDIIVEGYGRRTIQDRMARRYGPDHIDLYFPTHKQAREFGRRKLRMTVITP